VLTAFVLILYFFWTHISNILFSTNGTQSHTSMPFMMEYFVDKEKYSYLILFHANAATVILTIVILATGTIMIVYQKHTCGMFQIAR